MTIFSTLCIMLSLFNVYLSVSTFSKSTAHFTFNYYIYIAMSNCLKVIDCFIRVYHSFVHGLSPHSAHIKYLGRQGIRPHHCMEICVNNYLLHFDYVYHHLFSQSLWYQCYTTWPSSWKSTKLHLSIKLLIQTLWIIVTISYYYSVHQKSLKS